MQLQRGLLDLPGVEDAGAVMATPANRELLLANQLDPSTQAGPDDLLIVIRARTEQDADEALKQVDALLARRRTALQQEFLPKSLAAAARQLPESNWLLISVPGRFAAGVAREDFPWERTSSCTATMSRWTTKSKSSTRPASAGCS